MKTRSGFFFWMSVLLLGFVVVGFAPSLFLRPFSDLASLPFHLHVHGVALTSWYVWLVGQASMIRMGRTDTHRRLGVVGAIVGGVCVLAAPLATSGLVRHLRSAGLDWTSDMSQFPAPGIEGVPMELFAAQIVFGNIATVLTFAALLTAAIILRRRPDDHKRLILLASISLIGPALARIARWPVFGGEDGPFIPVVFFGLLIALIAHDLITTRRVRHVTWIGALATVLLFVASQILASTPLGSAVVRAMA